MWRHFGACMACLPLTTVAVVVLLWFLIRSHHICAVTLWGNVLWAANLLIDLLVDYCGVSKILCRVQWRTNVLPSSRWPNHNFVRSFEKHYDACMMNFASHALVLLSHNIIHPLSLIRGVSLPSLVSIWTITTSYRQVLLLSLRSRVCWCYACT